MVIGSYHRAGPILCMSWPDFTVTVKGNSLKNAACCAYCLPGTVATPGNICTQCKGRSLTLSAALPLFGGKKKSRCMVTHTTAEVFGLSNTEGSSPRKRRLYLSRVTKKAFVLYPATIRDKHTPLRGICQPPIYRGGCVMYTLSLEQPPGKGCARKWYFAITTRQAQPRAPPHGGAGGANPTPAPGAARGLNSARLRAQAPGGRNEAKAAGRSPRNSGEAATIARPGQGAPLRRGRPK